MTRPAPAKMSIGAAWAAWSADPSASGGSEFLERISSWIEGTSAQLLRARWPGAERPSPAELEARLRHHLEMVAQTGSAAYPEALELARRGLIEEIAGGAVPPQDIPRQSTRPRTRRLFLSAEK